MKAMKTKKQKSKIYTVLLIVVTLALVVSLSVPYTIQTSHAQVSSGNIGWYGAMAMGNLAENENRIEALTNSDEIIAAANIEVTSNVKKGNKNKGFEKE